MQRLAIVPPGGYSDTFRAHTPGLPALPRIAFGSGLHAGSPGIHTFAARAGPDQGVRAAGSKARIPEIPSSQADPHLSGHGCTRIRKRTGSPDARRSGGSARGACRGSHTILFDARPVAGQSGRPASNRVLFAPFLGQGDCRQ